ncbi:MAG: SPASM domain-containing protein [Proteobacteria bacterium]|nr:SPASM domain-containing protein [Pseudomonadota bacterium]
MNFSFDRINIEISNICNLKCSFCPAVEREKQVMSAENFEVVARSVAPLTKEIVLHLLGEPLGHPDFANILAAATRVQIPVNVVTNGVLLVGERPKDLLSPIVRQVSFSLHSFEANFPNQDPKLYLERILRFVERALIERPDLYINLRLWDLDGTESHQTDRNRAMRKLLSDFFEFDWTDVNVDLRRKKNWRIKGRLYLHFDSRFVWPSMQNEILQERGTCKALTNHIGIHADGSVVPCCLDHNRDIPLGNIFDQKIDDILQSERAQNMLKGFKQGRLVETLCKTCGFIERFSKNK